LKNILSSFQIFYGLSDEQLTQIETHLQTVTFPKGQYIIYENTSGNSMYFLFKGKVKVTKKLTLAIGDNDVEEKMLATLSDKDFPAFGEIGLVGAGKRTANVIALSDCVLFHLTRESYEKYVSEDVEAAYLIMKNIAIVLARRLESADDDVLKLATALSLAVSR